MPDAPFPPFVAGSILPVRPEQYSLPQEERLLPPQIRSVFSSIEISDYTPDAVQEAVAQRYQGCVEDLVGQGAQRITLAGFPIAAQLGRPRMLELLAGTEQATGIPSDSDAEATVAALAHLGVRRLAIASRWADQLNDALVAYLAHAGVEVLTVTTRGQWAAQAFAMSIEEGVKQAFRLGRQAMSEAPDAQALLLAGGVWRSLAAVPILEDDFDVPVLTNPTAQVWRLIDLGVAPPVDGWGRLLAG